MATRSAQALQSSPTPFSTPEHPARHTDASKSRPLLSQAMTMLGPREGPDTNRHAWNAFPIFEPPETKTWKVSAATYVTHIPTDKTHTDHRLHMGRRQHQRRPRRRLPSTQHGSPSPTPRSCVTTSQLPEPINSNHVAQPPHPSISGNNLRQTAAVILRATAFDKSSVTPANSPITWQRR